MKHTDRRIEVLVECDPMTMSELISFTPAYQYAKYLCLENYFRKQ